MFAVGGQQQRVDRLVVAAHGRHSAASPSWADLDLLAEVLGRPDERAGELAKMADDARIASEQCERDYDALVRRQSDAD
ncbi:DUF2514 family protein [Paraburkholderia acidisoli]|uniref:DUF2514 family protein n=1 Tax=Paraburkholderia acidisoli TaxID=2571748 RepID=A0A7Z2JFM2_9BURK|nr:DUF2514 family protein [Paraburkholderia acidisoli]